MGRFDCTLRFCTQREPVYLTVILYLDVNNSVIPVCSTCKFGYYWVYKCIIKLYTSTISSWFLCDGFTFQLTDHSMILGTE